VVGGRESTRVRGTRRAAVRDKLESIVDDWRHGLGKEEAVGGGGFPKRGKFRLGLRKR